MTRAAAPVALVAVLAALAGCGQQSALKPAPGHSLPQKPATAPAAPSVDTLLDGPAQARPQRSDDLLKRSEERRDDRFDLPPPG